MDTPQEKQPHDVITSDTDNATTIQPDEAPPNKREKFRKFRAYNTGMWNGPQRENTKQFNRQDDLHRYDSIASSLCLNDYQKSRGRNILDNFDAHKFGESIDKLIFGICLLVANNAVEDGSRYYPLSKSSDEPFEDVAESLGLDKYQQLSALEKVRAKTDI